MTIACIAGALASDLNSRLTSAGYAGFFFFFFFFGGSGGVRESLKWGGGGRGLPQIAYTIRGRAAGQGMVFGDCFSVTRSSRTKTF